MDDIHMKVIEWDETSNSIVVKFSSEEDLESIDKTDPIAFQPISMLVNEGTPENVVKNIIRTGIRICEERIKYQKALNNPDNLNYFKNMVGQTISHNVKEFYASDDDFERMFNRIITSGDTVEQHYSNGNQEEL